MKYKKTTLGEIAKVKNGYAYKSKDFKSYGVPIVKIKNISPPIVDLEDCNYVNDNMYEQTLDYALSHGDILISMTGSGVNQMSSAVGKVGRVKFYKKALQNQRVGKIEVINKEEYNNDFLYYYMSQENILKYFVNNSTGSANQANISKKTIESMEVPNPPIKIQIKIVCILNSFDKKIEVNKKIIENLEAQAQAIFKSWFVDFEPFADGDFVESDLGLIPKGWEVGSLGKSKLGKIIASGIEEFNNEKIYLATADVSATQIINTSTLITFNNRPSRANMQPRPKSVWFAKMKDSRKLILVDDIDREILDDMIFSTGFAGIQATIESVYYLWTYLISEEFDKSKNQYCEGTTMQAINNKNINKLLIIIPDKKSLNEYNKIVEPMFNNISILKSQNNKLASIRDTLLPKFMAGEIDIANINIED